MSLKFIRAFVQICLIYFTIFKNGLPTKSWFSVSLVLLLFAREWNYFLFVFIRRNPIIVWTWLDEKLFVQNYWLISSFWRSYWRAWVLRNNNQVFFFLYLIKTQEILYTKQNQTNKSCTKNIINKKLVLSLSCFLDVFSEFHKRNLVI